MARTPLVVSALALALSACSDHEVRVSMEAQGASVERTVARYTRGDEPSRTPFVTEDAARIATMYGHAGGNDVHAFTGTFAGALPSELGGSGHYLCWPTPLGTAWTYAERVRGTTDPWARYQAIADASDELVAFVVGWFDHELGAESAWGERRAGFETRLRRDLRNLGVVGLDAARHAGQEDHVQAALVCAQWLVDAGWVAADEAPALARAFGGWVDASSETWVGLVRRPLLVAYGAPAAAEPPAELAFLSSGERMLASLEAHGATPLEGAADDVDDPWELYLGAVLDLSFGANTFVATSLALPVAPFATNGHWHDGTGAVLWSAAEADDDTYPPLFRYALWVEADRDAQAEAFGFAPLHGEALFEHALWRHGLTPAERAEWDAFLSRLAGTDDVAERLEAFRFSAGLRGDAGPGPTSMEQRGPGALAHAVRSVRGG